MKQKILNCIIAFAFFVLWIASKIDASKTEKLILIAYADIFGDGFANRSMLLYEIYKITTQHRKDYTTRSARADDYWAGRRDEAGWIADQVKISAKDGIL